MTGYILGDWNGTSLNVTGGSLNGHSVYRGRLGGEHNWYLAVAGWGYFFFEEMWINRISEHGMTLWGQNRQAYRYARCKDLGYRNCTKGLGMDVYARSTKVSEPGSLALLGAGLLGAALLRRRKRKA